ncbi:MAG: hypothetical protein MAG431_02283 [Chloroflexi bacterium]|nr:hypothetical protein [Chloroflexota bacterium]
MNILVITPTTSFGELIRQVLEEDERFQPTIAPDAKQAFKEVLQKEYALAVVDDEVDIPLSEVVKGLRAERTDIKIILISPEPFSPSDFPELKPDACLGKPFYLPDFLEAVGEILSPSGVAKGKEGDGPTARRTEEVPVWLQDVDRTAQHLTRLSLETAAQAALIIRGKKMWAYAGQLSQPAADELVQKIAHYWGHDGESDLSRFIGLEETNAEYIIYATSLGAQFVLALAFETEVPFSKIRTQAGELARSLANIPAEKPNAGNADSQPLNLPLGDPDEGTSSEAFAALLAELNMPPSDATGEIELAPQESPSPQTKAEPQQEPEIEVVDSVPAEEMPPPPQTATTLPEQPRARAGTVTHPPEPDVESPPARDELDLALSELESPIPALQNLTYVCVLIPRLPRHRLVGDLARELDAWLKELSLAFGWRLEHLAVRPNYLQWIMAVRPKMAPERMMSQLRQHTSERIFKDFPRLARENPSGAFWAPGYLMVNGRKPLPMSLIRGFIDKTRQFQGSVKDI